jgi:TP53 regulating kinase-like protein
MILGQGAEAIISKQEDGTVLKDRPVKSYRHPSIDNSLRKFRTRREAKVFAKLEEMNFPAPRVHSVDDKEMKIVMDFVEGEKVADMLEQNPSLAKEIGKKIGILHAHNIVHGDLTTSNMILSSEVFFIDFGLSQVSLKAEDKAVDIHLFDRALESKHHSVYEQCFDLAIEGYKEGNPNWEEILTRLEKVEKRGRNKQK